MRFRPHAGIDTTDEAAWSFGLCNLWLSHSIWWTSLSVGYQRRCHIAPTAIACSSGSCCWVILHSADWSNFENLLGALANEFWIEADLARIPLVILNINPKSKINASNVSSWPVHRVGNKREENMERRVSYWKAILATLYRIAPVLQTEAHDCSSQISLDKKIQFANDFREFFST